MTDTRLQRLRDVLLEVPAHVRPLYAVLDGARSKRIHPLLMESGAECACLFRGELSPRLLAAAPWLVRLDPDSALFNTLLTEGWGESWGVFLAATAPLEAMRRHLRGFLRVKDEDGRKLLFRWYDPRVLRLYLPVTNEADRLVITGPIRRFVMEAEDPSTAIAFSVEADRSLSRAVVSLASVESPAA